MGYPVTVNIIGFVMLLSPVNHTMLYPFRTFVAATISGNNVMMPHIWPEFRAYRDIAPWLQKLVSTVAACCSMLQHPIVDLVLRG